MAGKLDLTYKTFDGIIVEDKARIKKNELVFVEYRTIGGKIVCSLPLPPVFSCPKGIPCNITCEAPPRKGVISNVKYHNRAMHNYIVLKRFTEMKEVDSTGETPAISTQVAIIASNHKYFLWNFTGEIQSLHHIDIMRRVAVRCPDTLFVCRTRLVGMVTRHIQSMQTEPFPSNLRIIMTPLKAPAENLFSDRGFDADSTIVSTE